MSEKRKSASVVLVWVSAFGLLGLTACEQRYVVKTSPGKPLIVKVTPTPDPNVTRNSDGSTTTRRPDGSSLTTNPDGSTTLAQPDGTLTITRPDGSITTRSPDGSTLTTRPDGSTDAMKPDGTLVTTKPDGTVITTSPDGTLTTRTPDGTRLTQRPDGTTVTTRPDGTEVTTKPDGTTITTRPDGTTVTTLPDGTVITTKPDGSTTTMNPDGSTRKTDIFKAASNEIKKIDFLFVIDNSGSMADNQRKLAAGFKAFANTFYRRSDLDICTMIITSDRYLGKEGYRGYERERSLPCTKPVGSEKWTSAQMQAHTDALISEFETKVYVGTRGNANELLGKSVVSFLYGINEWGQSTENSPKSNFFRRDAVANISFVSDENNYYFEGPTTEEVKNDLPYAQNARIPGASTEQLDPRKGLKEYLDEYFATINPGRAATYSTTSILELSLPVEALPGIAANLNQLPSAVGRESTKSDISGPAQAYTQVYQSIADAIVLRATTFTLTFPMHTGLQVQLRHVNGQVLKLNEVADFTLQTSTILTLNPKILPQLQAGDRIEVTYNYLPQ